MFLTSSSKKGQYMIIPAAVASHPICLWCGQEIGPEIHPGEKHSINFDVDGITRPFHNRRPKDCLSDFLYCRAEHPDLVKRILERRKKGCAKR